MRLFELITELLERLEVFDLSLHLLHFLSGELSASVSMRSPKKETDLAHLKRSFRQLHNHIFRTERIVQLLLEVVDLVLSVLEPTKRLLKLSYGMEEVKSVALHRIETGIGRGSHCISSLAESMVDQFLEDECERRQRASTPPRRRRATPAVHRIPPEPPLRCDV